MLRRLLLVALAAPAVARAQTWPDHPVRWIINFPPGGAADTLSRALCDSIGTRLGQPLVPENRPGAGGLVGADLVAKARGDQHIVIMSNAASHGIGPVLYANVPYDTLRDFQHVALVGTFPSVLCVNNDFPARTLAEFIAVAKQRGGISYGSGGNGTMNHLCGQLLAKAAGIELTHVPYRGSAPALTDTMGGQIPSIMESLPIALPHIRAGRLRPLVTSEAARAATTPEVPTFAEAGYAAAQSTNWFGFSIPAGVPEALVQRWAGVIHEALADAKTQARFANIGVVPGTGGPAEYTKLISDELTRWREVIRTGNIKAE